MVWVSDGFRVVKLSRTQVLPKSEDLDRKNITDRLHQLRPLNSHLSPGVLLTEVLKPNDPRRIYGAFDEAIANEVVGLLNKKAFLVVVRQEIDDQANILGGSFVLSIKKDTNQEVVKARYVVQGHLDREKRFLVHNYTTVSPQAVRLLV